MHTSQKSSDSTTLKVSLFFLIYQILSLMKIILQPAYPSGVCFGDGVQPEAMCGGALHPGAEGHHIWPAS